MLGPAGAPVLIAHHGGGRLLRRVHRHGVRDRLPRPGPGLILRDTSADNSNLERAFENARHQDRAEINWDNFQAVLRDSIRAVLG